jgi:hypothetical protein
MTKNSIYGLRVLGDHQPGGSGIRSDQFHTDKSTGTFIVVDGGSAVHCGTIAAAMLHDLRNALEKAEDRFWSFGRDLDKSRPIIHELLTQYVKTALSRGEVEISQIGASVEGGVYVGIVVPIADRLFYAHFGSGRAYHKSRGANHVVMIDSEETGKNIQIREIKMRTGDFFFIATDGYWKDNNNLSRVLNEAAKKSPFHAIEKFPIEPNGHEDRSAYFLWLDFAWHAACDRGYGHRANVISRTPIFKGAASYDEADALMATCVLRTFSPDDHVVREGDCGDNLFVLLSGRLTITSKQGLNKVRATPGDLVGEIAFLDGLPRVATVTAASDSELLEIPGAKLKDLIFKNPRLLAEVLWALARVAAGKLREARSGEQVALQSSETIRPPIGMNSHPTVLRARSRRKPTAPGGTPSQPR